MPKKKLPDEVLEYFRAEGKKGGKLGGPARAAKLTPEQRSEIARKAVAAREAKRAAEKGEDKGDKPAAKKVAAKERAK